jgi:hypothetical protein
VLEQKNSYRQNIDISSDDFTELNVDLLEKPLDILLPIRNKSKDEQYSEIISELNHFGINTLQNLKELVNNELTMVLETDRKTAEYELIEYQHKSFVSGTDRPETLVQGFFFNHTGLIRMMIEQKFGYSSRVNYWKSENVDP